MDCSELMSPEDIRYSDASPDTIDISSLRKSHFLLQRERQLPFRDDDGAVNLQLVERALRDIAAGTIQCPPDGIRQRLLGWQRHGKRALGGVVEPQRSATPYYAGESDEALTLDELLRIHLVQCDRRDEEALTLDELVAAAKRSGQDPSARIGKRSVSPGRQECPRTIEAPRRQIKRRSLDVDESAPRVSRRRYGRLSQVTAAPSGQRSATGAGSDRDDVGMDRSGQRSATGSDSDRDDVYEVERLLQESREPAGESAGGRGRGARFLVRWHLYGPEADSWEPEENISAVLVARFREAKEEETFHRGGDYGLGRARRLWCSSCKAHRPADSFSQRQKRALPLQRRCLSHALQ